MRPIEETLVRQHSSLNQWICYISGTFYVAFYIAYQFLYIF